MFEKHFSYYLFVQSNSRFLITLPANVEMNDDFTGYRILGPPKSAISIDRYRDALSSVLQDDEIRYLRGDAQNAFKSNSPMVQLLYRDHHIEFKPVRRIALTGKVKDAPYHTSLSIIDRVTRTLRDMAFNLGADGRDHSTTDE
jgi:hypothetical protein